MAKTPLEEAVDFASHLMRAEGKSVLDAAHKASDEFRVPFGEIAAVFGSRGGRKSAAMRHEHFVASLPNRASPQPPAALAAQINILPRRR